MSHLPDPVPFPPLVALGPDSLDRVSPPSPPILSIPSPFGPILVSSCPSDPSRTWSLPSGRPGHRLVITESADCCGYSIESSHVRLSQEPFDD